MNPAPWISGAAAGVGDQPATRDQMNVMFVTVDIAIGLLLVVIVLLVIIASKK